MSTFYTLDEEPTSGVTPALPGPQTPAEVTEPILEYLDCNTDVKVTESEQVAGRDFIAPVLTSQDANTTISQVTIAFDSGTSVPLSVRVGSTRHATPAIETTFTSLEYGTPNPEAFEFSPPGGATVVEQGESAMALLRSYLERPRIGDEWGSGRILEGNIFSAVISDDGRYAVGTVDGDALAAALGQRTTSTP